MRKEISIYLKSRRTKKILVGAIVLVVLFVLVNGVFIYSINPSNYYFYIVKKVVPYPAFRIANHIITVGQYEDLLATNKRIYENAYRVDFGESAEGKRNFNILKENSKKEIIEGVLMEDALKSIDQDASSQEVKKEYDNILEDSGSIDEINTILKSSSNINEDDIMIKVRDNLLREKAKENFIYNLKMRIIVLKPRDSSKQEDWESARVLSESVMNDLKQSPSSFDKYYALYGDANDFIVQNFGKKYYLAENLPESFRESFYGFFVDSIAGPLKNDTGYYIFEVGERGGYFKGSLDDFLKEQQSEIKIWHLLR